MQSTLTQKDAELCLKPQGLLATRIYASGHAYIRVGLHVRTHKTTHIYVIMAGSVKIHTSLSDYPYLHPLPTSNDLPHPHRCL